MGEQMDVTVDATVDATEYYLVDARTGEVFTLAPDERFDRRSRASWVEATGTTNLAALALLRKHGSAGDFKRGL